MRKGFFCALMLAAAMLAVGCDNDNTTVTPLGDQPGADDGRGNGSAVDDDALVYLLPATRNVTLTAEQQAMVQRVNEFSFRLFGKVFAAQDAAGGSLLMSPQSVATVLGMLRDGATGATASELSALVGGATKDTWNAYSKTLAEQTAEADTAVTMLSANMLATGVGIELAPQFRRDMTDYYQAEVVALDFSSPSALTTLNDWAKAKTQGMIDKILDRLSGDTRLVLMNAVYFKAAWMQKFNAAGTRDEQFTAPGKVATVPMMHRKAMALYAPCDGYSMLCLPYGNGSRWEMMVMLPDEGKSLTDMVAAMNAAGWEQAWQTGNRTAEVDIKLPKFTGASDIDLNDILKGMGAGSMFSNITDFTPMTVSAEPLNVTKIKQKAAIEVSEEGTKAAAVTVATMDNAMSAEPREPEKVDFHCNRPFMYVIRDGGTGAVFFVGVYGGAE